MNEKAANSESVPQRVQTRFNKHLMTGHMGNSEFCFLETLNDPRGEAEGNIEVEGKQDSLFLVGPVVESFPIQN